MSVFSMNFIKYLKNTIPKLRLNPGDIYSEAILVLTELCKERLSYEETDFNFGPKLISKAKYNLSKYGIIGVVSAYFDDNIVDINVDSNTERKALVLKNGYLNMPVTKATLILKGFNIKSATEETVRSIFASYGLIKEFKEFREDYDFMDINKRGQKLHKILLIKDSEATKKIDDRYEAIREYLLTERNKKIKAINHGTIKKGLFFHYLKSFTKYGFLGLIDKGEDSFRISKIGFHNEARIVIDKIQNSKRDASYYVKLLNYKGIKVHNYSITKLFKRWDVDSYKSEFKSNLDRLEESFTSEPDEDILKIQTSAKYIDQNFIHKLSGLKKNSLHVDSPGLYVLWHYIEKIGIRSQLDSMGLTYVEKGYSWFDYFLLNVGRIFYGISSYSKTCECEEPSLPFFSHLLKLPCNDSFINGIGSITQEQVFSLQRWLVERSKSLGLVKGKKIAFDFNQIDLNVDLPQVKNIGKGPSPMKGYCFNAFRPHIAWDLETGNIITAEFRKGSARGTTTIKRFIKDHLFKIFKEDFEEVYIDSEYTGKDVWNFILDKEEMGAKLIACIKQNKLVKKHIDKFLLENEGDDSFWCYWDDKHVISSKTFELTWHYEDKKKEITEKRKRSLYCCIKKSLKTGKLRCFATSNKNHTARKILELYGSRWIIENGIKDLIYSYFLKQCPGTDPHNANVHFMIVAICRHIFRMIEEDSKEFIKNYDGTTKTLSTMRKILFNQGSGKIEIKGDTMQISFLNSFSVGMTNNLKSFYEKLENDTTKGLDILGGYKLKYSFKPPYGIEHRNMLTKVPLIAEQIP